MNADKVIKIEGLLTRYNEIQDWVIKAQQWAEFTKGEMETILKQEESYRANVFAMPDNDYQISQSAVNQFKYLIHDLNSLIRIGDFSSSERLIPALTNK